MSDSLTSGEQQLYGPTRDAIERAGLSIKDIADHPMGQVQAWFEDARRSDIQVPNAMVLATVDERGAPTARTIAIDNCSQRGITFFTNSDSPKARHLKSNHRAAGVMLWPQLSRQVRISGTTELLSAAECDAYFSRQPIEFQLLVIASPQSQPVPDHEWLERMVVEASEKRDTDTLERPDYWQGYLLVPDEVEFWQARPDRLHDRIKVSRTASGVWDKFRLAP